MGIVLVNHLATSHCLVSYNFVLHYCWLLREVTTMMNGSHSHYGYFGILATTYNRVFIIKAQESEACLVITDVLHTS